MLSMKNSGLPDTHTGGLPRGGARIPQKAKSGLKTGKKPLKERTKKPKHVKKAIAESGNDGEAVHDEGKHDPEEDVEMSGDRGHELNHALSAKGWNLSGPTDWSD
jgi:hypothetical protein